MTTRESTDDEYLRFRQEFTLDPATHARMSRVFVENRGWPLEIEVTEELLDLEDSPAFVLPDGRYLRFTCENGSAVYRYLSADVLRKTARFRYVEGWGPTCAERPR